MKQGPFRWYHALGLLAGVTFALLPIFWMVSTSFKPTHEWAAAPPVWVTSEPTLANYAPIISVDFATGWVDGNGASWRALLHSFIISSAATFIAIVVGLMAATGFSRYRAGGRTLALAILSVRGIPTIIVAIPLLIFFGWLGLRDTHIGLILVYAAFTAPFAFWMLKSFVDDIPPQIEEAAMMDGMTRWQAHFRITLPAMKGGVVATALFIFILNWSEFLLGVVLTEKTVVTMPINIYLYNGVVGIQAALATVAALPVVIVGLLIHKHLARGFTLGAVKQ